VEIQELSVLLNQVKSRGDLRFTLMVGVIEE